MLDTFQEAQDTYAWGRLNAVVVVTDGRNDHPSGTLTGEQTSDQPRLLYDGMRPGASWPSATVRRRTWPD